MICESRPDHGTWHPVGKSKRDALLLLSQFKTLHSRGPTYRKPCLGIQKPTVLRVLPSNLRGHSLLFCRCPKYPYAKAKALRTRILGLLGLETMLHDAFKLFLIFGANTMNSKFVSEPETPLGAHAVLTLRILGTVIGTFIGFLFRVHVGHEPHTLHQTPHRTRITPEGTLKGSSPVALAVLSFKKFPGRGP